ncbi:MAG: XRE family transcriptional regulator [Subdoligranulum variabile]|nr:MAG: XRE family transcriptional regulator [Subdoligranulum variabile]
MEYTLDYAAIGKRVRKVRKERHLTQTELGDCCGVTSAHICHIEAARGKVSLPTLVAIANVLQVSLDELLCDNLVTSKNVYEDALRDLLSQATAKQARLIAELARVVLHDRYGAGGAFPGSLKTDG